MTLHSALVNAELHECKGASTASINEVPSATGSGGTTWQKVKTANIDTTDVFVINKAVLTLVIPDAGTATVNALVVPFAGTLDKIYTALGGAITGADEVLTFRNNAASSMGTITIANAGSALGDVDTLSPGSNNIFAAGDTVRVSNSGASTGVAILTVTMLFTVTGAFA